MKRDDLFAGYEQGQADMLAKCIAAVGSLGHYSECMELHEDHSPCTHDEVVTVLRALKEKP